jgi:hypothetical protein
VATAPRVSPSLLLANNGPHGAQHGRGPFGRDRAKSVHAIHVALLRLPAGHVITGYALRDRGRCDNSAAAASLVLAPHSGRCRTHWCARTAPTPLPVIPHDARTRARAYWSQNSTPIDEPPGVEISRTHGETNG